MNKKTVLNVIMVVMVILAIVVLLPTGTASKNNNIGYNSLCSFSPWSSLILFAVGGLSFIVARRSSEE